MAVNADVFRAILAMDSYNRGYNQGIDLGSGTDASGTPIGTATVFNSDKSAAARAAGFYGVAYTLASGEKIISYRGTDGSSRCARDRFLKRVVDADLRRHDGAEELRHRF